MLIFISPAKTLDFEQPATTDQFTVPCFLNEASQLIKVLREFSPAEVGKLMKLSDKLVQLNVARYASWTKSRSVNLSRSAKQSMFAFKGDVYTGLSAESLTQPQVKYLQRHLRILSGLYGVLKPLDVINPYRLEMGTKLATDSGKDLYQFWGDTITDELNKELQALKSQTVINLASNEYFKSINQKHLDAAVVTPVFKDKKSGKYKVVSFFAKKARGMMAAYAAREKVKSPEQLQAFTEAGYWFNEAESSESELVFYRDEPRGE